MNTDWFKDCKSKEEKEKQKQFLLSNKKVLKELSSILSSKVRTPKEGDYDSPSWAYKRADLDGYNRALTLVLELIDIEKGK
tara:strand:+ start:11928 stop:12170 length:243 start_codon:yes stop_codon:yes gene_type:complete